MARYIVERKGIFGTLYADSPRYALYPSTTSKREYAYIYTDIEKAQQIARKFMGTVINLDEEKAEQSKADAVYDAEDVFKEN